MSNETINVVCEPIPPKTATQKTAIILDALLNGAILNPYNIEPLGFGKINSLHSIISRIRNEWFIPVESSRRSDGSCDYFMLPQEIDRFHNQRDDQKEEMMQRVEIKRFDNLLKRTQKGMDRLLKEIKLREVIPNLPEKLSQMIDKVTATDQKINGAK